MKALSPPKSGDVVVVTDRDSKDVLLGVVQERVGASTWVEVDVRTDEHGLEWPMDVVRYPSEILANLGPLETKR